MNTKSFIKSWLSEETNSFNKLQKYKHEQQHQKFVKSQ